MRTEIWDYLFDEGFLPHGTCLLWNPTLFWTHAVSDAVIAASYFSIPIVLATFLLRRKDFQYRWIVSLFGLFIVLCGLSHVFGIWTLWVPSYAVEGAVKALTAVVSAVTAVLLWPLLPKVVAIPSSADLERQNQLLELEIRRHRGTQAKLNRLNSELEDRVKERTADLEAKTLQLEGLRHTAEAANEAKTRFLSTMSHEIRTPLNSVINMSSLLLGTTRDKTDRRYVGTISTASKALLAIVQDILDFSRIEAGQISLSSDPTDIETVVEDVVESVASLAHQRGLDIAAYIAPDVPRTVVADEGRLRQILQNLVGNAVNYTLAGSIQVRLGWQGGSDRGTLAVDVIDTGIGIAPEGQEIIFDRFSQVESERPGAIHGTGLGLSICQRVVAEMGGQLSVESALGRGSTFRLSLPIDVLDRPQPEKDPFDAVIFGGAEMTARLVAETLVDAGGVSHLLPFEACHGEPSQAHREVAILLAPVASMDPQEYRAAYEMARRWADRVVLYLPLGAAPELRTGLAKAGLSAQTYPVRRRDLASLAALDGQDDGVVSLPTADLNGLNILVVDDNDDNLFVADHVLSHAGASVHCVDSGEAALAALAHTTFDCILLDLRMPGLDGFQTARRIRELGPAGEQATIIAVSANVEPATLGRLAEVGVTDHLAKPYMPEKLWSAVQQAVGRTAASVGSGQADPVASSQAAAEPALDLSMIEQLVEFAGVDLVLRRSELFFAALPDRLALISTAGAARSAEEAHSLAGAAGSLGLLALSQACRNLEDDLRANTTPPSQEAIGHLYRVAGEAHEALTDMCGKLDTASGG